MKTVFSTQEGVKMNSELDFGDTIRIISEFEYLLDTTEIMWGCQMQYFYRVTDDNYIQLALKIEGGELQLSAQFKLRYENLNPRPTGNTKYSWVASCPFAKGKHFIMVSTLNDDWGCGYCGKGGNQLDLDKWLKEIKIK